MLLVPPLPYKTGQLPKVGARPATRPAVGSGSPVFCLFCAQMLSLAAELEAAGTPAFLIPVGGSDHTTGVWGFIEAFKEMWQQVSLCF